MKTPKANPRHPRFPHRTATDALLLGLAAGLLLACPPRLSAAVVYHDPADVTLTRGDQVMIDILAGTFDLGGSGAVGEFQVAYTGSETIEINLTTGSYADAVGMFNTTIGSMARFSDTDTIGAAGGPDGWSTTTSIELDRTGSSGFAWDTGSDGTTGRIGLRLTSNGTSGGIYYAWLGVRYDDAANSITLLDMAYESTASLAINPVSVPEPGTWAAGLLLAGAVGIAGCRYWRRS